MKVLLSRYLPPAIVFAALLCATTVRAGEEDMLRLKERAGRLNGVDKIRAVIKIARTYTDQHFYKPDSALLYAKQALRLADASKDVLARCEANYICGVISLQLSLVHDGLQYYRRLQQLAAQTEDSSIIVAAERGIATALWYQGKFGQALDTLAIPMDYFDKKKNEVQMADVTMTFSSIYSDMGNYEKAFEYALKALDLSESSGYRANVVLSLVQLGYLYNSIGDYATAMNYFRRGFELRPDKAEWAYRHLCNRTGDLYCNLKKYDSAFYFYRQSIASHSDSKTALLRMGDYYLVTGKTDQATAYYKRVYTELKDGGEGNLVIFALLGLGKASLANNEAMAAVQYCYKALGYALQRDSRLTLRDTYQLLSQAYEKLGRSDSAFLYYKEYMAEHETVVSRQFKGELYAYKHASQIRMLENEKLMNEQQLKSNRLTRNILVAGIVVLLLLGWIILRNISLKRKNENLLHDRAESEWRRRAGELEMQALRAQMNPHFIFNALSSVNRFILKNDPEKASDYLTRFSRLIRLVLINSQRDVILLEEEIEMLRLYLQIEQLRFKDAFDYEININEEIDPAAVFVPPLLLQPFCENAIWHGLMHQQGPGKLSIDFSLEEDVVLCTITDNGVGISRAGELGSRQAEKIKSLGLRLTRDRLAIFNRDNALPASYEIEEIRGPGGEIAGTRVRLRIRHQSFTSTKPVQA